MATATKRTTRPDTPAVSYAKQKQQAVLMRLGAFVLLVAAFAIPRTPSPLLGVDWWKSLRPSLIILWELMPPEPLDVGVFVVAPRPVVQWLSWLLAAFLAFLALSLVMHLGALYAQRTRPLGQKRTYLRLLVPALPPGKPTDAVVLLKSLHGMVPPANPMQPAPPPLMICWTARPERKVQQAVSVSGPQTVTTGIQKRLLGIRSGVRAETIDDPLLAELRAGRFLCVAEVRTIAGNALPIAVVGKEHTLLTALLPSLATQAGVFAATLRIILSPIPDRLWRLDVQAVMERVKGDAGNDEQQALKAKVSGPTLAAAIWVMVVADDPAAGVAQVQTIGTVLAGSAQAVGSQQQRLQLGPVQVLPAVVPHSPPFPRSRRRAGLVLGLLLATLLALFLWRSGLLLAHPLLWAVPPLVLWLPLLLLAASWRKRTKAELPSQHAAIIGGIPKPRNPRVVPIWWPWLGKVEA